MKFISFKNVKAIVVSKGMLFGAPIHYVVTNDNNLHQVMTTSRKETLDKQVLKEGIFVNDHDVSELYLRQNGRPKISELLVYRRLKKNINKETVTKFITENYETMDF